MPLTCVITRRSGAPSARFYLGTNQCCRRYLLFQSADSVDRSFCITLAPLCIELSWRTLLSISRGRILTRSVICNDVFILHCLYIHLYPRGTMSFVSGGYIESRSVAWNDSLVSHLLLSL